MIIRRRHTANYTMIGNALFDDERLAADEVGILAVLLSRPHDWEVRRPALMRRWHIGRDAMKRIITNWMRTGWCRAIKTRLSNGTFHIIYEIRDQPGPELSEDEVRRALSLVSSEAADGESEGENVTETAAETAADQLRQTHPPPTGQPGVDDQGVVTRRWSSKSLLSTDSVNTESTKLACGFGDVLAKWPPDHVLSAVVCEAQHAGLTDKGREAAFQGVNPYLSDCAAQNRKVCDLATYYREHRWERFASKTPSGKPAEFKMYSPQWYRWRDYRVATGQPTKFMDTYARNNPSGTWTEPTEWPPGLPPKEVATTGPPQSITQDDKEFIERK